MISITDKKWFQNSALIITILGSVMVVYISYLLLWPQEPLKVVQPYHVITPVVNQGTRMAYDVEYCLDKARSFTVHRVLLNMDDGDLWDVADRVNHLAEGCSKEVHDLLTPMRIDEGRYKMIAGVSIQINPIRTIHYQYETEEFQIVKPVNSIEGVIE